MSLLQTPLMCLSLHFLFHTQSSEGLLFILLLLILTNLETQPTQSGFQRLVRGVHHVNCFLRRVPLRWLALSIRFCYHLCCQLRGATESSAIPPPYHSHRTLRHIKGTTDCVNGSLVAPVSTSSSPENRSSLVNVKCIVKPVPKQRFQCNGRSLIFKSATLLKLTL